MTTANQPPDGAPAPHAVVGFAHALRDRMSQVTQAPLWSMSTAEQEEALVELDRAENQLAALKMAVLAQADRDGAGSNTGATSAASWLAAQTRATRAECGRQVRTGHALDTDFQATGRALAAGAIQVDQARVIIEAVRRLSTDHDDLPPGTPERAEAHLLQLAEDFDAVLLRRLAKRLFEVVCPDAADADEGEQLKKDEERARRRAWFSMRDNGDGTHDGHFRLPDLHAAVLKQVLQALCAPRRVGDARIDPESGKNVPYPVLLGQALMELIEDLDPDNLPTRGGGLFSIVITMSLDALLSGIGAASLDTGERISASEARRLACRAGLIPMVLGGDSVPLDLGRERRLFTKHQRVVLAHRFGGCAEHYCDRPPAWVEIHHRLPWSHGGGTDLGNGLPLCAAHHRMADHPDTWTLHTHADGSVRFHRRT